MSEENLEQEQNFVEILGDDGTVIKCEIYDVIDFEEKTYALLVPIDEEDNDDAEVIVMEYIEKDDEGFFQNIDDEKEFNKICAYIQSLSDEEEE